MRTKTRATKFRSKLTRVAATTRPLPALNLETDAQISEFNDTDPSEDYENVDLLEGNEDISVVNSVDKSAHNSVDPSEYSEDADLLEGESFCVRCNRGVDLLVCFNSDCPVAIHKDCLVCDPKYDQNGNFCCPYCWYKTLSQRTTEMRQKAMLARKALSGFIDSKLVAGDGEKRIQGNVHGTVVDITLSGRDKNCNGCETSRNKGKVENLSMLGKEVGDNEEGNVTPIDEHRVDPSHPVLHGVDDRCGQDEMSVESLGAKRVKNFDKENVLESHLDKFGADEEGIQEEGSRQVDDGQHEGVDGDHENEVLEEEFQDHSHYASVENPERMVGDEHRHSDMPKTATLNTENDIVPEIPTKDACSYESSESYTRPLKRLIKKRSERKLECQDVSTPNKSPSQLKKPRHQIVDSPKKPPPPPPRLHFTAIGSPSKPKTEGQSHQSTLQIASMAFCNGQRRRLLWTPEEEEMLKEGVEHFSTSVNKSLPWRKILEFGREVFHPTRNPSDLKDKWRKLLT